MLRRQSGHRLQHHPAFRVAGSSSSLIPCRVYLFYQKFGGGSMRVGIGLLLSSAANQPIIAIRPIAEGKETTDADTRRQRAGHENRTRDPDGRGLTAIL